MSDLKDLGRSIAIWSKGALNNQSDVSLHINFWQFDKSNNIPNFFDIGLRFESIEDQDDLFVFIPVELDKNDIKDLSSLLGESKIATGIFNESLSAKNEDNVVTIFTSSDEIYIKVYKFISDRNGFDEKEIDIELLKDIGTIITIKKKVFERSKANTKSLEKLYFRLRINLPVTKSHCFVKKIKQKDWFLLSGFWEISFMDFRYNEIRNLPKTISRKISDTENSLLKVKRIDFLLVSDISADLAGGHKPFHKSRILEPDIWSDYIKDNIKIKNAMVIYHWKEIAGRKGKEFIEDFNAFVKMRHFWCSREMVLSFVAVTLVLGALGGALEGGLVSFIKANF